MLVNLARGPSVLNSPKMVKIFDDLICFNIYRVGLELISVNMNCIFCAIFRVFIFVIQSMQSRYFLQMPPLSGKKEGKG